MFNQVAQMTFHLVGKLMIMMIITIINHHMFNLSGRTDDIPLGGKADDTQPIQDDSPDVSTFLCSISSS